MLLKLGNSSSDFSHLKLMIPIPFVTETNLNIIHNVLKYALDVFAHKKVIWLSTKSNHIKSKDLLHNTTP